MPIPSPCPPVVASDNWGASRVSPANLVVANRPTDLTRDKLALPGEPLQQACHDPATHALSDLGLLSELVIQAFQQEEQSLSRALHRE